MILLAKFGTAVVSAALVAGAAVSSEGFIHVKVHEKHADGTNINLYVPAALAITSLHFVPDHDLGQSSEQIRPYLPIIDAAIPALRDSPDGVLVEVRDATDHVLITKRGSSIVVDVNDPDEVVHVSVPLCAAQSAIHRIAEAKTPERPVLEE